jgi:hypothetical protein
MPSWTTWPHMSHEETSRSPDSRMISGTWVIARPNREGYSSECLRWEVRQVAPLSDGEVLFRTLLLSLDPTSLNWLKLETTPPGHAANSID